jgi:hypothetical protein
LAKGFTEYMVFLGEYVGTVLSSFLLERAKIPPKTPAALVDVG